MLAESNEELYKEQAIPIPGRDITEGLPIRQKIASDSREWPGQPAGMLAEAKRDMDKIVRNDFEQCAALAPKGRGPGMGRVITSRAVPESQAR